MREQTSIALQIASSGTGKVVSYDVLLCVDCTPRDRVHETSMVRQTAMLAASSL